MKKKLYFLILAMALIFTLPALSESPVNILTKEPWIAGQEAEYVFNTDGTGIMDFGTMKVDFTWTYQEPTVTLTIDMYGTYEESVELLYIDGNWELSTEEGPIYQKSRYEEEIINQKVQVEGYQTKLGETITLPFVKFQFEGLTLTTQIRGGNQYIETPDGYKYLDLVGTIENTSNNTLAVYDKVNTLYTFDDKYNYPGDATLTDNSSLFYELLPLASANIHLYVKVPDTLVNQMDTVKIYLSFNDNMKTLPKTISDGRFVFSVTIDNINEALAKTNAESKKTSTNTSRPTVTKTYKLGNPIVATTGTMTLKKAETTSIIYSNKTGKGRYLYYESNKGEKFYAVSGSYKNTSKKPQNIQNIYATMIIDDEYEYRAYVTGVSENTYFFISDVAAQSTTDCVVYSSIPQSILSKAKSIMVKIGFTDDYGMIVTSSGLPKFEKCTSVFYYQTK